MCENKVKIAKSKEGTEQKRIIHTYHEGHTLREHHSHPEHTSRETAAQLIFRVVDFFP
jgi:hypothetical protein